MLMRAWDWLPIKVTITIITWTMMIMITVVWFQNSDSCSLCNYTDNNLTTFFTINKFCMRNLQSVGDAAYLSLLVSITLVERKANSTYCLSWIFSLFQFPSFLSSLLDYCISVVHSCVLLFYFKKSYPKESEIAS